MSLCGNHGQYHIIKQLHEDYIQSHFDWFQRTVKKILQFQTVEPDKRFIIHQYEILQFFQDRDVVPLFKEFLIFQRQTEKDQTNLLIIKKLTTPPIKFFYTQYIGKCSLLDAIKFGLTITNTSGLNPTIRIRKNICAYIFIQGIKHLLYINLFEKFLDCLQV